MICLLAATPHETTLLRRQLPFVPSAQIVGQTFSCDFYNEKILLLHTGIGIASAASSLSRLLAETTPELLINFGCGGSYPESGLQNGDLALATSECFGDLGAATDEGFVPLSDLGILPPAEEPPLFIQKLDLQSLWLEAAIRQLLKAEELSAVQCLCGPFVTVNTVSGTEALSQELGQRNLAICENMEGAALAQVARSYSMPLIELRGISNPCGTRDRSLWDLAAGIGIAQQAVLRLLKELSGLRSPL